MNKFLINLVCSFIPKKNIRDNFRKKHLKQNEYIINFNETNELISKNNILIQEIQDKQKFLSYHNLEKILPLKDKYKGEKIFIIGGSPSLKKLDLTKLNNSEFKTFSVGRGYKLKENKLFHSNFHIVSDIDGYNEIIDEFDENYSDIFFSYCGINFINNVRELIYFDYFKTPINMNKHYQEDLTKPLFHCETVVDFALQIATYMGFKEIYFIGVDLDFIKVSGHIYKSNNGENERQKTHSQNNNLFMLSSFEFATPFLKERNVNLYNASPDGILNCMPRIDYNSLFNNKG